MKKNSELSTVVNSGFNSLANVMGSILAHPAAGGLIALGLNQLAYKSGLYDPREYHLGESHEPAKGYFYIFMPPEGHLEPAQWVWYPTYAGDFPYVPYNRDPETDPIFQGLERLPDGHIFTHDLATGELVGTGTIYQFSILKVLADLGLPVSGNAPIQTNYFDGAPFNGMVEYYYNYSWITGFEPDWRIIARTPPPSYWGDIPEFKYPTGYWKCLVCKQWTAKPINPPGYEDTYVEGGTNKESPNVPTPMTWVIDKGGWWYNSEEVEEGSTLGAPYNEYYYQWKETKPRQDIIGRRAILFMKRDWGFAMEGGFHLDLGTPEWSWTQTDQEYMEKKEITASQLASGIGIFIITVAGLYAVSAKPALIGEQNE